MKSFLNYCTSIKQKGFTLIEFIVIISIFAIMASVALFNFQGFRSNVGINNLAHDIALVIRQAQVFGWGTITNTLGPTGDPERFAQGVYFNYNGTDFDPEFILYTKNNSVPGNEWFQNGDTVVDTVKIQGQGIRIIDIRRAENKSDLALQNGNEIPPDSIAWTTDQSVSFAFSRPRPEPIVFGHTVLQFPSSFFGIYIGTDETGLTADRVIIISPNGEISVQ